MNMNNSDNLLKNETSPYLLQHADNPVNWFPWNEDALNKARDENKPILLSIGYSACHWCHVMAHESFEDEATAALMNQHFINIKVDREERPDLDKIYQTAHSLLTSRPGGWPLTVFLSPQNQMPFFAGTYFPKHKKYNMPTFTEILKMVSEAYHNRQADIEQQNASINKILNQMSSPSQEPDQLNSLPLDLARKQLGAAFDRQHGGFSQAPKFPHAPMIERLLRHHLLLSSQNNPDINAYDMATFTLDKMALGGFQDHLGGGFFRYSTDDYWMIPHFEKMLYDNAQLFALYAQSFALTDSPLYRQTLEDAANWLIREMQTSQGGYCSALDADTDKIEGKTYVWTPDEVKQRLNAEDYKIFASKFNLFESANFEDNWHLHSIISNQSLAEQLDTSVDNINQSLNKAQHSLLAHRNLRNQPGRDDKILCSWNALMIRGMSLISKHLNKPEYLDSAFRSAEFIKNTLWKDQRLLASFKDGKAHLNAYLDDYAYLLQALLELLQCKWRPDYFNWALQVADSLLENFEDQQHGGFYFTSHDHEKLLYRSKTFADDAMPNGNAIASYSLLQLGLLCGETRYIDAAERTLKCAYSELSEHAISHCSLLNTLELYLNPRAIIILRGSEPKLQQWKELTDNIYAPGLYCLAIESEQPLPAALRDKQPVGEICAYICEGTQCLPVINKLDSYKSFLTKLNTHEKN